MDSGSEKLTFSLKNGGKLSRFAWGSFLSSKNQKVKNKVILGFIYDFKSRLACHNDPYSATAAPLKPPKPPPKRLARNTYELELPQELAAVHPVFHVPMLKKYMGYPSLIIPTEYIGIKDSLSYEEIPVQILDRQVHKVRTKEAASVKVLWRN
ncbi:hypothetical protein MTR67_042853 [Solanum verrucosum]|uniref:Tf2-1-like SH3-like domain-containing protein n=1 Tax=Solanum verrucosum TaxID=315347 RepID=A0AAF0UQ77_SOLVR|nr:hypothetical protein MTR67_042853 [Solanum verrucosum]